MKNSRNNIPHYLIRTLLLLLTLSLSSAPFAVEKNMNIETLNQSLLEAISDNNLDTVKRLIAEGASPNAKTHEGSRVLISLLHFYNYAEEREDIILHLIRSGADIDYIGGNGESLLHSAASMNMLRTVQLLIEKGLDPGLLDENGEPPVFHSYSIPVIDFLRKIDEKAFNTVNNDGKNLLFKACDLFRNVELVEYLLPYFDLDTVDNDGNTLLHAAVNDSYNPQRTLEIIKLLIAKGIDVNRLNSAGRSAVSVAAAQGRGTALEMLKLLVAAGADINQPSHYGLLPIHYASANSGGDLEYLLLQGADYEAESKLHETPLLIAVRNAREHNVRLLLDRTNLVNIPDQTGRTALNYAVAGDFSDIAEMLRKHGAVEATDETIAHAEKLLKQQEEAEKHAVKDFESAVDADDFDAMKRFFAQEKEEVLSDPIHSADIVLVDGRDLKYLKYLLDHGLDAFNQDSGYSLLHVAVFHSHLPAANYLLELGLDVNKVTDKEATLYSMLSNSTPEMYDLLHQAGLQDDHEKYSDIIQSCVWHNNIRMATFFESKGYRFDPNMLKNEDLLIRTIEYQSLDAMKYLLERDLDTETMLPLYGDNVTLLHFSIIIGANEMALFLMQHKADPNAKNSSNEPIFREAINRGNLDVIKALYENGAKLEDTASITMETPLQLALYLKRPNIARLLVELGSDIHKPERNGGDTPLHSAARLGYLDTLKLMIEKGGNIHQLNDEKQTPLDIARKYKQQSCIEYLEKLEAMASVTQ